mmetsp:Transcript_22526/g.45217  ORF Transcript_22526/g.45217 Transcript_22526/m.45217 type:complete len:87 (-) Transcript_22526:97-357(-)
MKDQAHLPPRLHMLHSQVAHQREAFAPPRRLTPLAPPRPSCAASLRCVAPPVIKSSWCGDVFIGWLRAPCSCCLPILHGGLSLSCP